MDIAKIAGIITDTQHGDKTGIPDAHHSSNQPLTQHSDVEIVTPADAEDLTYEAATALWKNKPAPAAAPHADTHHAGGTDPLDLALIAGTITDTQHATKTGIPDAHHRKWSWADEGSWIKKLPIPYGSWIRQNLGDPIIAPHGNWTSCEDCCAIYDEAEDVFYIWYGGRHTLYAYAIGLAKFDYKTNTTTYLNNDEPVLVPADVGVDYDRVRNPSVIFDNGTYYMLVMAYDTVGAQWDSFSFQSTDKITWTAGTKLFDGYFGGFWIKLGDAVYAIFVKAGNIYAALGRGDTRYTSLTLYTKVILSKGATGEWDDGGIAKGFVYWSQGVFYILYPGFTGVAVPREWRVGMAVSGNGWIYNKFFDNELNPVFGVGATGKFDDYAVAGRDIVMLKDRFFMFYAGHNGTGWAGIGYATLPY